MKENYENRTRIYLPRRTYNLYSKKNYVLPSGKLIKIQGYENKTLDKFLKYYNENDLVIGAKNIFNEIGRIDYYDRESDKNRVYIPDMYIKSTNTIIETKSDKTFRINKSTNIDKMNACISKGLNFNFAIHIGNNIFDYDINKNTYTPLNL